MPQRLEVGLLRLAGEPAAQLRQHQREQKQRGELRGERLGRGDADLGPGAGQETQPRLAHQRALRHVADRERLVLAERLGMLQRGDRVGSFARLGDGDHQRVRVGHTVAIAVLARDLDVAGHAGDASIQ